MKEKQRLIENIKKIAKEDELHFNQILSIIAYERAILRLAQSEILHEALTYKGGLIMRLVYQSSRFTKDLDASFTKISTEKLKTQVEESLSKDLDDGFEFKNGKWSVVNESSEYQGLRYSFEFSFLEKTSQFLQVDFTNSQLKKDFVLHTIKNTEKEIKIYPKELIMSEKLQTLVKRGSLNTRAKDVYDINFLFDRSFDFDEFKEYLYLIFKTREIIKPESFYEFAKEMDTTYLEQSWSYFLRHKKTKRPFSPRMG